jgi:hypothetical protein
MSELNLSGMELGHACDTPAYGTEHYCQIICQSVKEKESYSRQGIVKFQNLTLISDLEL